MYPHNTLTKIPKPEPPDYEKSTGQLGGKLEEFNPIHRRFPGPYKRKVEFSALRFPGYPHYHVKLKEEHNTVFSVDDAGNRYWVNPWNDPEGEGKIFQWKKTASLRRAHFWAKLKFAKEFDPETHELVFEDRALQARVNRLLRQGD